MINGITIKFTISAKETVATLGTRKTKLKTTRVLIMEKGKNFSSPPRNYKNGILMVAPVPRTEYGRAGDVVERHTIRLCAEGYFDPSAARKVTPDRRLAEGQPRSSKLRTSRLGRMSVAAIRSVCKAVFLAPLQWMVIVGRL